MVASVLEVSTVELIDSPEVAGEVWAIVPTIPVLDFHDLKSMLPDEYQGHKLAGYVPLMRDGAQREGWILHVA